jgi:hypothetical protein
MVIECDVWTLGERPSGRSLHLGGQVPARDTYFWAIWIAVSFNSFRFSSQSPLATSLRLDFEFLPPCHFVAGLMQLPVTHTAEPDGELGADFEADGL